MKRLGIFISLLILLLLPVSVAFAQNDIGKTGPRVIVAQDEVIDSDFFVAGETVEIYGTINGDLYVAGGQLIINGTINGDLLAAGGQIDIDSTISQDARIAGGQITIDGTIGRNLTVAGGDVTLQKDLQLANNLVAGTGNLKVNSAINGDLAFGAGNALIDNTVGGDVKAGVGILRLGPDADVAGDLVYWSEEDVTLSGDATVAGTLTKKLPPESFRQVEDQQVAEQFKAGVRRFASFGRLVSLISSIIIGYILVHFFPNYSYRLIKTVEDRPGASFLLGLAALLLTPILGFLLFIPVITIPLAIILWVLYGLFIYVSRIFFMYWLGARLLDRLGRGADKTITLLIGIGLYYVLTAIAIIGPITALAAVTFGLGALLLSEQRCYLSGRKLKIF